MVKLSLSRKIKLILGTLIGLFLAAFISVIVLLKSVEPNMPKPVSDVPLEYKIGWWAYQEALEINELSVSKVDASLNLFNSKAVIQYSISGSLVYEKGWRPYIKSVFISERWDQSLSSFNGNLANIELIPIVDVKDDSDYSGQVIPFSMNLQDYLHTGGWGMNKYNISVLDKVASINLEQLK